MVVYDALVGDGVLSMIPQEAERINVGKRSSHHLMPQEEIRRLLAEKSRRRKAGSTLEGRRSLPLRQRRRRAGGPYGGRDSL